MADIGFVPPGRDDTPSAYQNNTLIINSTGEKIDKGSNVYLRQLVQEFVTPLIKINRDIDSLRPPKSHWRVLYIFIAKNLWLPPVCAITSKADEMRMIMRV